MSPNVSQCCVWVCCDGPDGIRSAPHKESVATADQRVFPPVNAEAASACMEVGNLRAPSGDALAVLAFEVGFYAYFAVPILIEFGAWF